MAETIRVNLKVNGKQYVLDVPPDERLIDTLRYRLGFTSVKEGCGRGECGSCIVLVNGLPRHSCLALTATLDGAEILTVEGLAPEGELHAIQVAFLETRGVQCGFCTPAFMLLTKALLDKTLDPSDEEIKQWLASVICRCGSYHYYFKAVRKAAEYLKKGKILFDEKEVRKNIYKLPLLRR